MYAYQSLHHPFYGAYPTAPLAVQSNQAPIVGGVDGGECDTPLKITWPSDVDHLKQRIGTIADDTNDGVQACLQISPEEKKAWNRFYAAWQAFAARKTPVFGSHGEWVTACTYSNTIEAWRDKLKKICDLPGPDSISGPNYQSVARWASIAAIAIGGAIVLTLYAPEIKGALGFIRK